MNWFHFLKNKQGKLTFGIPQMAAVAGVGLVVTFSAFQADKKAAEQERVRSLSSISGSYNYGGMRPDGRGNLTSINVKDGLNQVATAEERARLEAGRTGGDFGLSAADNLGSSVSSSMAGRAAGTSETEGLGMGRNAVTMQEAATGPAASGARVNPGDVSRRTGRAGSAGGQQLAPASVSRASGSGLNASYGGASSGGSGVNGRNATGASSAERAEGYKFSGAMPSGTDPLSLSGASGRRSSGFMAGGRNATTGRGSRSKSTGNDLKDISKRSADAALNRNRAANEGSRAFLASAVNSGGMNIDSSVETQETGSADFAAPEARHLKAIGGWGEKEDAYAEKQTEARKKLMWWILGLIAGTAVAIPLVYRLISGGKKAGAFGWLPIALGIAMAAAVTVAALRVIQLAVGFLKNYKGPLLPIVGFGAAAAAIGAMGYVIARAFADQGNADAQKKFLGKSMGLLKKVSVMGVQKGAGIAVQQIQQADANAANSKSEK